MLSIADSLTSKYSAICAVVAQPLPFQTTKIIALALERIDKALLLSKLVKAEVLSVLDSNNTD
ncbi:MULTISPECIES: hypothetical protein [Nostoc]|uniref:Uncharacterized protein n=2 Tax=Nostoc TaxID=1177 RepID=A0ABR8IJ18_9NOSO|nr:MULTISPECIES: hypothetical protein [Nostoc]MBD2565132.1 hypothetical protein [Nostoc linckia FACHB-391]MBD2650733.1 hypothetical protein [Nostoc foliaceum FACHB-393]